MTNMNNILNKADVSFSVRHKRDGEKVMHAKRALSDWSQGGLPGKFRMVPKADLNIDGRYQRERVSDSKVKQIARKWDWVLLGVILVVERVDGSLWVFDGGHRTRASFYRDDVHLLPCMIYKVADLSDEAKAFLGKNLMTTNVSSVDKFKASVVAEDEVAIATKEILQNCGVEVKNYSSGSGQLRCVNTMQKMVGKDVVLARRCFEFMMERADGTVVRSHALRALFTLCDHFASDFDVLEQHGAKLARHSQDEFEVRIRQMRAECGKGGEKIDALALLSIINKGRRAKLSWNDAGDVS